MNNSFKDFNFLNISEQAAISVFPWIGKLDKYKADEAATHSMRAILNTMPISAKVIIGEGEMDEAPMLFIGEELGQGGLPIDIAVDPLDGTTLTSKGQNNAITIMALSTKNSFLNAPDMYMKKMAVGKSFKGFPNIQKSLTDNIRHYITVTQKKPEDITIAMLDRERHKSFMQEVIELGCKLLLLSDGDILPAILTGIENSGIDILYGIGAAPEGVIAAAALKAIGGDFQGLLVVENQEQEKRCQQMGIHNPKEHIFTLNELVKQDEIQVVISAVTDGYIGDGVKKIGDNYIVHSLKISHCEPKIQFIKSIY